MVFRTIAIILFLVVALILLWPMIRTAAKKGGEKYGDYSDKVDPPDPPVK